MRPYRCALFIRYANGNIAELYTLSIRNVRFGYHRDSKPDIKALRPITGRWIVNVLESPQEGGPVIDTSYNAVAVTKVSHNSGASWVRPASPSASLASCVAVCGGVRAA